MGKALATKLAQQGANVCIVARTQSKLDQAIEHIKVLSPTSSTPIPTLTDHPRSHTPKVLPSDS